MTFASAVLEAIDAILALAYIGLQIYYGVCYHIQVFKFVANILVLLLVYIAITWLQHYPEKLYQKVFTQAFDVCKACFYCGASGAMRV